MLKGKLRDKMKLKQRQKKISKILRRAIALVLVVTVCLQANMIPAKTTYRISQESLLLNKGSSQKLTIVNAPSNAKIKWSTSNKFAVSVSKGVVKGLQYGTATITAKYKKKYYYCRVTVPDSSKKITPNTYSVNILEGKTFQLTATSAKKVYYHSQNQHIATVNSNGLITGVNPGTTKIILRSSKDSVECSVTVAANKLNLLAVDNSESRTTTTIRRLTKKNNIRYERINWAKNKTIRFKIANLDERNIKKCVWSTSNGTILTTPKSSESKIVAEAKTVNPGDANVIATVTNNNGSVTEYSNTVHVSNPVINTNNLILLGSNAGPDRLQYISFTGLSQYSKVTWTLPSTTKIKTNIYRNKIALSGDVPESGIIQATVDGKTYNVTYTVYNPIFNQLPAYIIKGKTAKINIGNIGTIQPTYTSRNKSIATVAADGTITGKKSGVTYVDVKIGNYSFAYRVEVAAKGMKKIIDRATYIVNKWKYSQKKRMKKKYYDCSSLVWKGYKAYKSYQKKLGSKTWAKSAGELFDYLKQKKKIVYYGYLGCDYMKPGDLIFYGDYNSAVQYSTPGRTLNIYHVAMYAGNGRVVEKGGQPINYNNLNHVVGIGRVVN